MTDPRRHVCIHGHFYQPPRENPWLETLELQDSAYPYHDWNERIAAECYAPNAAARILDEDGLIRDIVSNYERMSFNVGPTLLAWMEDATPGLYEAIIESDRRAAPRFGGHGPAIAQAYNHVIMPLASSRDKATQIRWGIADFRHRFGRDPEGMWLPETAVDLETLELMAAEGIRFTILEPHQIDAVRPLGADEWEDRGGGQVDPTRPYLVRLGEDRTIAVFVYDGHVSRNIAFEGLLDDGNRFADRLLGLLGPDPEDPRLVNVATDGETYGHHHRHGEMALAYALDRIEQDPDVRLTVYGEFLEAHPPELEARIVERTAWSCVHGVDRWRADCGCSSGMRPGWNQAWRAPLREALDRLRARIDDAFERLGTAWLLDPWEARDDYVGVVLDRSAPSIDAFLERHVRPEAAADPTTVLELMELQRHAMLMYTSCGWFFDEVSGIETVQVLQYAARALQLAERTLDLDLEPAFLDDLSEVPSNLAVHPDATDVYRRYVRPAAVDLPDVAAHYALSSLFVDWEDETRVRAFDVRRLEHDVRVSGRSRLAVGRAEITSRITRAAETFAYAVLHLGDQNLTGGVARSSDTAEDGVRRIVEAFDGGDVPETLRGIDEVFGEHRYSLRSLFRDEQQAVVSELVSQTVETAVEDARRRYEDTAPLLRFLAGLDTPIPSELRSTARVYLQHELAALLVDPDADRARAEHLLDEAELLGIELDREGLAFRLGKTVEGAMAELEADPGDLDLLERVRGLVDLVAAGRFDLDLTEVENGFFRMREAVLPEMAARTSAPARRWTANFRELGAALGMRVDR